MSLSKTCIALIFALAANNALAEGKATYTIFGGEKCPEWIKDRDAELKARATKTREDRSAASVAQFDRVWLAGFLSGVVAALSTREDDILGLIDLDTAVDWVTKYCRQHPTEDAYEGGTAFVVELLRIKHQRSETSKPSSKGEPTTTGKD
jgi:hypothetical protein